MTDSSSKRATPRPSYLTNCLHCKKEFRTIPAKAAKYCSYHCMGKDNEQTGSRQNLTYRIPKGSIPWNKNKGRHDVECPNCKTINSFLMSQKTRFCNKKCFDEFQTHKVPKTYGAIHKWMRKNYGIPSECEHCGDTESKKFEWANISGQYKLERSDWARLCCQCHRRYDLGNKLKIEKLNI